MRKVFLKFFLIICFALSILGSIAVDVKANEPVINKVVSGEEYIYIKVLICDTVYVFKYTLEMKLIDIYPDECGGGPHGGPH